MTVVDFMNDSERWCKVTLAGILSGCLGYGLASFAQVDPVLSAKVCALWAITVVIMNECLHATKYSWNDKRVIEHVIAVTASVAFPCLLHNLGLVSIIAAVCYGAAGIGSSFYMLNR